MTYTPSHKNSKEQGAASVRYLLQDRRKWYKLAIGNRRIYHWYNDEDDESVASDLKLQILITVSISANIYVPKLLTELNDRLFLMQLVLVSVPMNSHCLISCCVL